MHRIDEVARAARMRDQPRPRQLLHQQADAAGVVEVHVGRDHVVDRVGRQAGGVERGEQARHRMVGAGIDEGGAAAFDDQVGGVEERPMKAGVDDVDAVAEGRDEGGQDRRGGARFDHGIAGDEGTRASRGRF